MFGLVSLVGAKTSANDAMPCWVVHGVELSLENLCDVIENTFLLEGVGCAVDSMLLHHLRHVCEFDDCVFSCLLILLGQMSLIRCH